MNFRIRAVISHLHSYLVNCILPLSVNSKELQTLPIYFDIHDKYPDVIIRWINILTMVRVFNLSSLFCFLFTETPEELLKFGWMIIKDFIMQLYLMQEIHHSESK